MVAMSINRNTTIPPTLTSLIAHDFYYISQQQHTVSCAATFPSLKHICFTKHRNSKYWVQGKVHERILTHCFSRSPSTTGSTCRLSIKLVGLTILHLRASKLIQLFSMPWKGQILSFHQEHEVGVLVFSKFFPTSVAQRPAAGKCERLRNLRQGLIK